MRKFKRLTALVLAVVMVAVLAGCGSTAQSKPQNNVQLQLPVVRPESAPVQPQPAPETVPAVPMETEPDDIQIVPLGSPAAEPDRDSLEQIADLVTGTGEDYSDLTDEELTDLIEDQLCQEESADSPADPDQVPVPSEPAVDTVPATADNSMVVLYAALAVIGLAGVVVARKAIAE